MAGPPYSNNPNLNWEQPPQALEAVPAGAIPVPIFGGIPVPTPFFHHAAYPQPQLPTTFQAPAQAPLFAFPHPPPVQGFALPMTAQAWSPPPTYAIATAAPPPASAPPPQAADHTRDATIFPRGKDPEISLLFSEAYCIMRVINSAVPPWDCGPSATITFRKHYVDVNWPVATLMDAIRRGEDNRGWAISEVMEAGDGRWTKGTTIGYEAERAKLPCKEVGWSGRRNGDDLQVVWGFVHKL